ncbi:MAG: GNAT family N-acetyltransferase [Simkania sp.]|nr:GNAT family N-acetyltransferase [Simkania sp.]
MKKIALLLLLAFQVAWGVNLQDHQEGNISYEWNHLPDFEAARELFIKSFLVAYGPVPLEKIGVENKETFLEEAIDEELLLFFQGEPVHWLIAKEEGKVIGLLILDLTHYPEEVYGRQMAIHPDYLRHSIGTGMAKVAHANLPESRRIVAITRVFNTASMTFFESLGFKRCTYMHEGYDPSRYVGYEIVK